MILATPVAQVLLGELAAVDADLGRAPIHVEVRLCHLGEIIAAWDGREC